MAYAGYGTDLGRLTCGLSPSGRPVAGLLAGRGDATVRHPAVA